VGLLSYSVYDRHCVFEFEYIIFIHVMLVRLTLAIKGKLLTYLLTYLFRTTGIGTLRRTCWRAGSVSTAHTTEGVVKYIQLLFDISSVSEQTVRTNIAEIYNDPNPEVKQILRKLVIFRRNSQQK